MIAVGLLVAGDRRDDLDLEPLIALALGEQLPAAAEERVRGHLGAGVEAERLGEATAPGRARPRSQAAIVSGSAARTCSCIRNICILRRIVRRLVTEAVRHHIDQPSPCRQRAARAWDTPDSTRLASARPPRAGTTRSSRRRPRRPAAARGAPARRRRSCESSRRGAETTLRNPLRSKCARFRTGGKRITSAPSSAPVAATSAVDPLHRIFELAAAAVHAGDTGRDQQTVPEKLVAEGSTRRRRRFGGQHLSRPCARAASTRWRTARGRC